MTPLTEQIAAAFNRAADDVIDACELPDEGARDAINLVINAGLHYFTNPNASLDTAIGANYDEDPRDWIRRNV